MKNGSGALTVPFRAGRLRRPGSLTAAAFLGVAFAVAGSEVDDARPVVAGLGGHSHPLVVRVDGEVEPLGQSGPAVGWLPDATRSAADAADHLDAALPDGRAADAELIDDAAFLVIRSV